MSDRQEYQEKESELLRTVTQFDGSDEVYIYLSKDRAKKKLANRYLTKVCPELLEKLYRQFGEENVKVVEKTVEKSLQS